MKIDINTAYGPVETYVDGKGTPVLLLHGTGGSATSNWTSLVAKLRPKTDWQYIRPNLPGSGRTACLKQELSLEILSKQIIAILDELNIEKAHVIGFSLGASLALYAIGTYPERFLSGTSIGGFINTRSVRMQLMFDLWLECIEISPKHASQVFALDLFGPSFLDQLDEKKLDVLVKNLELGTNWEGIKRQIKFDKIIDIKPALSTITQPILLLTGLQDQIVPYANANELYHQLPQSKLIELDTGHASILERPEEVANLLVSFIKNK